MYESVLRCLDVPLGPMYNSQRAFLPISMVRPLRYTHMKEELIHTVGGRQGGREHWTIYSSVLHTCGRGLCLAASSSLFLRLSRGQGWDIRISSPV